MEYSLVNAPSMLTQYRVQQGGVSEHQSDTKNTRNVDLMNAAQSLEASFLAEMLTAAGLGQSRQGFGGGAGEDQFASFLVQEQATAMVQAGGIGLSEMIFQTLKERQNDG